MKAVLRLIWSYFTCTPLLRVFSGIGVVSVVASLLLLRYRPQSGTALTFALASCCAFFLGSSLMPLMFGRLAVSRGLGILPYGRLKLLASVLCTLALAASPLALLSYVALATAMAPPKPDPAVYSQFRHYVLLDMWRIYTSEVLLLGWLYVAMWFVTSQRNAAGYLKAVIVVAVVIMLPTREITTEEASIAWNVFWIGIYSAAFAVAFLNWPWIQRRVLLLRTRLVRDRGAKVSGREVDLLLGTAHPWVLGLGQFVPVAIAARIGYYSAEVWLFYLTMFSTVAGALAGQAAQRSRALWLRGEWSREELFLQVERSFWRHNNYVLGILLVLMLVIGTYANLAVILLAVGLPLLILGTTVSTYLGLMLTHRLRWQETVLSIAVMLALLAVAVLAARSKGDSEIAAILAIEVGLAGVAVVLRRVARNRWSRLDWMQCRPNRALTARGAA
jgi:hypothetical protein